MTLHELFQELQKIIGYTDDRLYYKDKNDEGNEEGYSFIYYDDGEIIERPYSNFKYTDFHNETHTFICNADEMIGFVAGVEAAFEANAAYAGNSTGNEYYKKAYCSTMQRLMEDNLKNPVPEKENG